MTHLTRDVLVKTIVAEEMMGINGEDYTKQLKEIKHKWEHASSEELCKKYNQIQNTTITVDTLNP
jgi:FKBP-type peptidyl-prolyl cis-trans isomerase (trigger factor)